MGARGLSVCKSRAEGARAFHGAGERAGAGRGVKSSSSWARLRAMQLCAGGGAHTAEHKMEHMSGGGVGMGPSSHMVTCNMFVLLRSKPLLQLQALSLSLSLSHTHTHTHTSLRHTNPAQVQPPNRYTCTVHKRTGNTVAPIGRWPTCVLWKYLKARPLRKSRGCMRPATGRTWVCQGAQAGP